MRNTLAEVAEKAEGAEKNRFLFLFLCEPPFPPRTSANCFSLSLSVLPRTFRGPMFLTFALITLIGALAMSGSGI